MFLALAVWQTRAHAAAFEDDPAYSAFTQMRDALSSAPILAIFVHMSGNARRCLESPVTEVDVYKLQDDAAEKTQDMIRRLTYRIESLQMRGFYALSWGRALEDVSRGAYIAGWRTIEVRIASPSSSADIAFGPRFFFYWVFIFWGAFILKLIFFFVAAQEHMRLGTLEEHKIFVQESEPIFEQFEELFVSHVHFKLHETTT